MKADRYPACSVCGRHHRYGVSHDAWLHWKERLAVAHASRTRYVSVKPSPEVRAKIGAASRGRRHSEATKAKLSELGRGRPVSSATRALIREGALRSWRDPAFVRRNRDPRRCTSIEKIVYGWLNELGIRFHREQPIVGGIVDVYCNALGLAIEVDGEYWHPPGNGRDENKDWLRGMATLRTVRLRESAIRSGVARVELATALQEHIGLLERYGVIAPVPERAAVLAAARRLRDA